MIIFLSVIGVIAFVLIVGKINLSMQSNKQVEEMFSQSKIIRDKTYSYKQQFAKGNFEFYVEQLGRYNGQCYYRAFIETDGCVFYGDVKASDI